MQRKIFPAIKIHDTYYALTDYGESLALQHNLDFTDIYSNSWGSSDDGETMEAPGPLTRDALKEAIEKVRVLVLTYFKSPLHLYSSSVRPKSSSRTGLNGVKTEWL